MAELLDLPLEEGSPPDVACAAGKACGPAGRHCQLDSGPARGCGPLVIVLEDLHWVDASSLELVGDVLGGIAWSPVLILLSTRPQFQPSWPASPHAGELRLEPLADAEIRGIVKQLETAEGFLTEQEMTRVAERAGGVPLFAIELTRLIWEQHTSPGDRQIPASLSDLLMARLDQLGAAKGVARARLGNRQ